MSQPFQHQCFTIADRAGLVALLEMLETKVTIYFGKTTVAYPYTDYGCTVARLDGGLYTYIVEGKGIGSSEKSPAELQDTVRRVFADCQRFSGCDTVTIQTL